MSAKRVAIIGGGFSGAALASVLMRAKPRLGVTLIERGPRLGYGLAYGAYDDAHLLNVRASNMSLFADAPDHFARWLKARTGAGAETFAARKLYGDYVADTLRKSSGVFGHRLQRVRGEAIACERAEQGWRITLAGAEAVEADAVVLALGHNAPGALGVFAAAGVPMLSASDPQRLPPGDVLLVGAGLTMVDVTLSLTAQRRAGTIYALSRRGLTPRPHLEPPRPRPADTYDLPLPLSDALHAFRLEVEKLRAAGEPWQQAMERLRHHTTPLWQRLSPEAQRRFLRHLRPWWDVHRHRMPPQAFARIEALKADGRLRILAGDIAGAEKQKRGVRIEYRPRGGFARHHLDVVGVVNCTGGEANLARADAPLIQQLLHNGLARAHANGLGFDLDPQSRVLDAQGRAQSDLFALGPLTQGAFWESTAVPDIRIWAALIARELLQNGM